MSAASAMSPAPNSAGKKRTANSESPSRPRANCDSIAMNGGKSMRKSWRCSPIAM